MSNVVVHETRTIVARHSDPSGIRRRNLSEHGAKTKKMLVFAGMMEQSAAGMTASVADKILASVGVTVSLARAESNTPDHSERWAER